MSVSNPNFRLVPAWVDLCPENVATIITFARRKKNKNVGEEIEVDEYGRIWFGESMKETAKRKQSFMRRRSIEPVEAGGIKLTP
ncbi:unnamed protein product [Enterobius vermicularis]|uniref:MOSC domain-containing protein n=1 Tax=Enterobius vermicularis TaxID=51028 RepID=A0A0N4UVG4_ENTVE|nr:unnamed protein product [Enterobius vermicularis]